MNLQQEIATLVTGAIVGLVAETHKPLQLDRDSETDSQTDRHTERKSIAKNTSRFHKTTGYDKSKD